MFASGDLKEINVKYIRIERKGFVHLFRTLPLSGELLINEDKYVDKTINR